jgi:chitinase
MRIFFAFFMMIGTAFCGGDRDIEVGIDSCSTHKNLHLLTPCDVMACPGANSILDPSLDGEKRDVSEKVVSFLGQKDALLSLPYIDATAYPTPDLSMYVEKTGISGLIAGFVTKCNGKACWGGYERIYDSNTGQLLEGDATSSSYHREAFLKFPESIISIGGVAGLPPCADPSLSPEKLKSIYRGILDNYQLKGLDFDFEGAFLADRDSLSRHLEGIKLLLREKPDVRILYTLPVDGSPGLQGFSWEGVDFLEMVREADFYPFAIQCMLMEFGQGANPNLFEASRIALEGAHSQLERIFGASQGKWSEQEVWAHMGAIPMFGRNNNGKIFTLENQKDLNTYCFLKGVKIMSGWDMIRDVRMSPHELGVLNHTPYDFSKTVAKYSKASLLSPLDDLGALEQSFEQT